MAYNSWSNQLSRFDICPVYVEQAPPLVPILKKLPWEGCEGRGKKIPFLSTSTLPATTADAITTGQALNTGDLRLAYDWEDKDFSFVSIVTDREIDNRIVEELSIPNPAEHYVVQTGVEAVWQKYGDLFINGVKGAGNQYFDGLKQLTSTYASQTIGPSGPGLLFDLDKLLSLITAGDGVPTAILANSLGIRAIQDALRTAGLFSDYRDGMRLHFNGIPVLPHHFIGTTSNLTDIYVVSLGIGDGLTGIYPNSMSEISASIVKRPDDNTDKSYILIRLVCGLALYRPGAIARLEAVDVTPYV